jgi:Mn-dependent DtxR family transcriptional regulator
MCHGKMRRMERAAREERRERLWDLFDRETRDPAPSAPVVEREEEVELEREEVLSGAARPSSDRH